MTEIAAGPPRAVYAGRALCAEVSADHGEPLAATASRVDHWLLVEYRHLWSRDTIGGSGLADEVKSHLRAQIAALPNARLLFIRRPDRRGDEPFAVFFGRTGERDQRFLGLEIERYEELLGVDVAASLAGAPETPGRPPRPVDHPLLVVCTHGKRDRCCAKFGRPLYDELREQVEGDWVWQSTHVGGDRFAGNLVCLPEGLYFGRVERQNVWGLLDEYLAGRIELAHYRGRSCHAFPVQAAERRVREEMGILGIDDLRLEGVEAIGERGWNVRFAVADADEVHEVEVVEALGAATTYLTCSAARPQRPRHHVARARRVVGTRRPAG